MTTLTLGPIARSSVAVDVSQADYACILFQMNPQTGGPQGFAREHVLALFFDATTGAPAGCLTARGFFHLALIEDPYGAVSRGTEFWPDIETFLEQEVLQ